MSKIVKTFNGTAVQYSNGVFNIDILEPNYNYLLGYSEDVIDENKLFHGIEGAYSVYRGIMSDPVIVYFGYVYNLYEVEEFFYDDMYDEIRGGFLDELYNINGEKMNRDDIYNFIDNNIDDYIKNRPWLFEDYLFYKWDGVEDRPDDI